MAAAPAAEPAAAPAAAGPDAAPFGPAYAAPMIVSPRPTTYVEPILTPAATPPEHKPLPSHVGLHFAPAPPSPGGSAAAPPMTVATTPTTPPTGPLASVAARTPTPAAPPMQAKLVVLRGQRIGTEYPVYEGRNVIGRFADKPVDIDLMIQEAEGQIWSSRQHAAVLLSQGALVVEDLNSLNGTWVNGSRLHAGQQKPLKPGDVIQIGAVQLKVVVAGG